MSYGTATEVSQLRSRYTSSGSFTASTIPSSTAVTNFLARGSALIDVMLAREGFTVPVTATNVLLALDDLAVGYAVDLCDVANSAGRFYDESTTPGNPLVIMQQELSDWFEKNAPGLERMGATRTKSVMSGLAFRTVDNSGDDSNISIFPIESYGNKRKNWDPS